MHNVVSLTDPHPSNAGMTSPSDTPIGRYVRVPVQVHEADRHAPEAALCLIALIAARWPANPAEHVGSSAVPGLAGKNTLDLLLAADPADIPAITQALLELGFQPQLPAAFPATRPMLWGSFRHGPTDYRVHVHVVPASSPEVAAMRGFRDALRADPLLRRRYAALKRAIADGGPVDPTAFTKAKHDWIVATLDQLGLGGHQHYRLYEDDPSLDSSHNWPHEAAQQLLHRQARHPAQLRLEGPEGKRAHDQPDQDAAQHDPPTVIPPSRSRCRSWLRPF